MKASDVMVTNVITAGPDLDVRDVARLMYANGISGLPVTDDAFHIIGMVSEGDLLRRADIGTERKRSWWLNLFASDASRAIDFVKSHAVKTGDIMTRKVVVAGPDTPLRDVAGLLEKHGIKRVPIVEDGQLVGIVSRANIVQALACLDAPRTLGESDEELRKRILTGLSKQDWAARSINVLVKDGVAEIWGVVSSDAEKDAVRVAVESTSGVVAVRNNLRVMHLDSMI